jgi:hypothetical protein
MRKIIPKIIIGFLLSSQANALSLYCEPLEKDSWQTAEQFNFKGTCETYRKERPSSVGCYPFRVELNTNSSIGVLDLGSIHKGRLTTTQTKYFFETGDETSSYNFQIDRRNLNFWLKEKFQLEVGGQVVSGMIDVETGICFIDTSAQEENKI